MSKIDKQRHSDINTLFRTEGQIPEAAPGVSSPLGCLEAELDRGQGWEGEWGGRLQENSFVVKHAFVTN